jgi:hypothetical protein
MSKIITQNPRFRATAFINLNEILGGGLPNGRLIEIYGRSQIGKTSLAIKLFPNETIVYIDLSRKVCTEYLTNNVVLAPTIDHDILFDAIIDAVKLNSIIIIDDLTMLGTISDDSKRFRWLTHGFMRLQRELVSTESIVIVLNQIRVSPSTGHAYNPHEGVLDAAVKIKMHFAENKGNASLVYLDLEKHFWGKEGSRCTLLVSKNSVTVPTFYKPKEQVAEENFL